MMIPSLSASGPDSSRHDLRGLQNFDSCLDSLQLIQLEWSFRQWVRLTNRYETRLTRHRIFIVFLLIRYTGATLNEVLTLNLFVDLVDQVVFFRQSDASECPVREVTLAQHIAQEIRETLGNPDFCDMLTSFHSLNPSTVRHTFFERTEACRFSRGLGTPESIRMARVMELLRQDISPRKIEQLLGVSLSRHTLNRKTPPSKNNKFPVQSLPVSALTSTTLERNCLICMVVSMQSDLLQSQVHLLTYAGHPISAIITSNSAERLSLKSGNIVTAEIKAHLINLQVHGCNATSSVDNGFSGKIIEITRGQVSWECVVNIGGAINIYSLHSAHYAATLGLKVGKSVWVSFNSFAIILHTISLLPRKR